MSSKLLRIAAHEAENLTEVSLREDFELLKHKLKPPFPLTIPSPEEYLQLNRAILFGLLTEPQLAKTHSTHLHAIVTDGYGFFVSLVLKLVTESYPKLLEPVRVQLIWVTSKLVDVSATGVDNLLISLLRQIVGGDFSDVNLWLAMEMLKVLLGHWDWLLGEPLLLTSALFTYLRLLADHYRLSGHPKLEKLKRMEIDFCVKVLREHFNLCLQIGRDLIRLLQDLFNIPEFRSIWKDLLLNPDEFRVPGFSDITHLYHLRTKSRYLLLRITPEMETQLRFLLTHVRWGSQKRYQAWFARKFFCGPERETLIPDLIRFICCAHHPPNEIIQSNIIQRWAIIGWLLKCCRKNHVEANAKLALFFDWLFFDERVDNIMNIEPGILLMVNSIPKYVDMTHTLLEFLFLLVDNYDVARKDVIVRGVSIAFGTLIRKGVVHSLDTLISCNALSPLLKERLVSIFPSSKSGASKVLNPACLPHCSLSPLTLPSPPNTRSQLSLSKELKTPASTREEGLKNKVIDTYSCVLDSPLSNCSTVVKSSESQDDIIFNLVQNLGESIKQSYKVGLQTLDKILVLFANLGSEMLDIAFRCDSVLTVEALACRITDAFKLQNYKMFSPLDSPSIDSNFDDEIESATAVVIRNYIFSQNERMQKMILFWLENDCPVGARLLSYASRLAYEVNLMGCTMDPIDTNNSVDLSGPEISLLKCHVDEYVSFRSSVQKGSLDAPVSISTVNGGLVTSLVEDAFSAYRCYLVFSQNILHKEEDGALGKLLFSDLKSCCGWIRKRLKSLFCSTFSYLSDLSTGEEDIIQLLVEQLDHVDVVGMQFDLGLKKFFMFGLDSNIISHLVKSSLSWGFVEQQKLWLLMRSEFAVSKLQVNKVVLDFFSSGVLDPKVHSIAAGGLLMLCSCCAPTPELVGTMISLPNGIFQDFAATVLASWAVSNAMMLFDSLANCLEKANNKNEDVAHINSGGMRINHSSILKLLSFLNKEGMRSISFPNKEFVSIPEIRAIVTAASVAQESG
ncbi:PREDICTED: uncharacterized protein LOC104608818 [Nelumbo nucifera]|uniref:Uncharacterized protein LOC104608818 n=2 Tax=Nelumbo nucifera TaxID=4432 RepID=A0A1U8B1X4_NELNU|nr:PREDICTED: uncharacterized protein LOC104608818 [Nelumbo nucifera]XP_010273208.1 PREDICTED: uncharacterized protein LOC104608818 [Nelumbo nucifera]XP_010273211.1 PREDICTED: uncharacterized protein LOC104608818 [Nelumbo nucifera]XP_010273213.1 PREDICTED: uncharacterized protein LOC104608818 [Nelumbo nucifera]DAD42687.1 TPA_asm: hypothetical protein HUJ06_000917 [Nelumbo nucifera]